MSFEQASKTCSQICAAGPRILQPSNEFNKAFAMGKAALLQLLHRKAGVVIYECPLEPEGEEDDPKQKKTDQGMLNF